MNKLRLNIIISLMIFSFGVKAQHGASSPATIKTTKELMQEAELAINQMRYKVARGALTQALKQKKDYPIAYRMLGLVNTKLRRHQEAIECYEKLFKLQGGLSKAAYYECGESYMKVYDYEKALSFFYIYKNAENQDYKSDEQTAMIAYDMYVDRNISSCKYARTQDVKAYYEPAENLGKSINTPADEYLPAVTADNQWLVFTSNLFNENILVSKQKTNGDWADSRSIGNAINTPFNEAMAKITVCGRKVYFSACAWENVKGGCDVYEADFDPESEFGIIDEVRPSDGINSEKWDSQPAISCDAKMMFFASNRKGGQGGTDIWMSTLGDDGLWDPPTNLGPGINTPGDEEAPYIALDGITLYFSSDGHPGFGEADIFRSVKKDDGTWSTPKNLGLSINTPFREAGITISPDGGDAYFASACDSGYGGLDIYKIGLYREIAPELNNVMVDACIYDASTKEPIEGVEVKIGKARGEKQIIKTDESGRFFACMPNDASYSYILRKEGYQMFVGADYFKSEKDEPTKNLEIFMIPDVTVAEKKGPPKRRIRKNLSVYYDSGKYELSELQKEQIERMVNQFEDKSKLTLKITGFADDVGNVDFNKALSAERAKLVAAYIYSLGIDETQINYSGGGVIEGNIAKHQKRCVEIIINN